MVEGVIRVFESLDDLDFAGSAPSIGDSLGALRAAAPEVVLLDDSDGIKAILEQLVDLKKAIPRSALAVWTAAATESETFRAIQRGATGVLRKTAPVATFLECVRAVARGEIWMENGGTAAAMPEGFERRVLPRLTAREREIVHFIHRGYRNRDIAGALSITAGTVKVHLMHIFEKTGVKDRFELAVLAHRLLASQDPSRARAPQTAASLAGDMVAKEAVATDGGGDH
jgi:DNA-binding NarL/FixJ family response regulator